MRVDDLIKELLDEMREYRTELEYRLGEADLNNDMSEEEANLIRGEMVAVNSSIEMVLRRKNRHPVFPR